MSDRKTPHRKTNLSTVKVGLLFVLAFAILVAAPAAALAAKVQATPTPTQYVTSLYQGILDRAPDDSGLAGWVAAMDSGMSRDSVASAFMSSNEGHSVTVNDSYIQFLDRGADPSGSAGWTAAMDAGMTVRQLNAHLCASEEFYANAGSSSVGYVNELYLHILGRPFDTAGRDGWVALINGGMSRYDVAYSFLSSDEGYTKFVEEQCYLDILKRGSDPSGLAGWVNAMASGMPEQAVRAEFYASVEHEKFEGGEIQLTITDPTLTLSKEYDGNTTAAVTAGTLIGVLPGDTVTVTAAADYATAAVGTGKTITVVYTLGGADAAKYVKPVNGTNANGVITTKQLTISAPILTLTKEYDGNTTAAVTAGTLSGVVVGETVTVTAAADYATAAVGTGKTITVVYTLGGADAAKYVKPVNGTNANGVITTKQLTISAPILTLTKEYDGNTTAAVTAGTLSGVVVGETVTVTAAADYATAAVGTGKTITVVYTLGGADAAKYVKPVNDTNANGVITTKQLTISAPILTLTKEYDGNTTAAVTAGTLSGVVVGETVTVTAAADYATAAVGTGKTITVVYTLGGADAAKYVKPVNDTNANGVITTKQLTISAPILTLTKEYDGNTTAAVTAGTLSGVVVGETVTVTAAADYATAAVGTGKTITVVYTLGGADAAKYVKPVNDTNANGVITTKQLTISAPILTLTKEYDGNTTAAVTAGTLSGVVVGETVTVTAAADYATAAVGTGKTITVVYTLGGADAAKYVKPVNGTNANGVITTAPVTAIGDITGTPRVGHLLTAGALTPAGATVTYQWRICNTVGGTYTDIGGATASTYTPVAGDVGKYIKVAATGTGNYSGTVTSAATTAVAPPLTANLIPSAAGNITEWDPNVSSNWQCVADPVGFPDNWATYVYKSYFDSGPYKDLYNTANTVLSGSTIISVRIYARLNSDAGFTTYAWIGFNDGVGEWWDDGHALPVDNPWTDYNTGLLSINPRTSAAWTWAEIDALQTGQRTDVGDGSYSTYCTQVYAVVEYDTP